MKDTLQPGIEHVFSFLVPWIDTPGKEKLGVSYSGNCLLKPIYTKHFDALDGLLG